MIDPESRRLSRLIALQTALQTKRLITAPELAKRFSVSVRTIYRDLKMLESAGVPLLVEEGRGYSLADGYRLPPVTFTEAEANALITVEKLVQSNQDTSLVDAYGQAMTKIRAVLRATTQEKSELLASRIKVYTTPRTKSQYVSILQSAITDHRRVSLQYQAASGELTSRTVEPFALLMSTQENWLLVGWCQLRQAFRIFRLDRITQADLLAETFQPHPLTLKQYFATLRE